MGGRAPRNNRGSEIQSVDTPTDTRSDQEKMDDAYRKDPDMIRRNQERYDRDGAAGSVILGATALAPGVGPVVAGVGTAAKMDADAKFKKQTQSAAETAGAGGPAEGASDVTTAIDNQTRANRPNQAGPFGFSNWSQDANGNWTNTTGLSGGLDATAKGLMEQARINALRGVKNGEQAREQAITGAYDQSLRRLDPQWRQRDDQLSSTLANQGLDPNSQAYRNAMLQQGAQRNDAYGGAMSSAIAQGTAAQNAVFNQNMQAQMVPYQQMEALYGLSRPFGFNAAASPNVLGERQLNSAERTEKARLDADLEAAKYSAGAKIATAAGTFIKDNYGKWKPDDGSSMGGSGTTDEFGVTYT